MKTLALAILTLALAAPSLRSETAQEIASRFETKKIEAIEIYLKENPEVDDKDQALSILVDSRQNLGDFEPIPDLLSQRYDLQPKGPEANVQLIAMEIARPFIEASIVSNQRDKAKAFITKVKADFADSPESPQLNQFLDQVGGDLYLPGVGDRMDFAFTDLVGGEEIDIAEMGDKVVLIDFWATWCGPCIAEMPHVVSAYEKYKDEGFEIVGISLDDNKASVEKFISDNNMPWPQYFDGKGWENELAQRFGIRSIPATFLVGKEGKIVASNLRGNALEEAIEKALAAE